MDWDSPDAMHASVIRSDKPPDQYSISNDEKKDLENFLQVFEALSVPNWSRLSDSNRGPTVYKTVALPLS